MLSIALSWEERGRYLAILKLIGLLQSWVSHTSKELLSEMDMVPTGLAAVPHN